MLFAPGVGSTGGTTRSLFPLRFGWTGAAPSDSAREPFAISQCFGLAHVHDGIIRHLRRIVTRPHRRVTPQMPAPVIANCPPGPTPRELCIVEKRFPLPIRDWINGNQEFVELKL